MKAHLVKGSAAAKAYMAKLRSKKTKVGAVKKKAAPKKKVVKITGLSKAKSLQKDLKSKGLKLTHGYNLVARKIGSIGKISAGANKLWIEINKKGLFMFNSEENILASLYDEAIRKGYYKKAEYLKELIKNVTYY